MLLHGDGDGTRTNWLPTGRCGREGNASREPFSTVTVINARVFAWRSLYERRRNS